MSGLDALEELQLSIQEALEEEASSNEGPRSKKAFTPKSVRDLKDLGPSAPENVSHSEVLESWQALVQSLFAVQVFLQYTPALERFFNFVHMNLADESDLEHIQTLLDLMTETVDNHDKDPSTECRYVTLLEVLTTYEPNWETSRQVKVLWDAKGHDLESSMSPGSFRQTAYGVLMSLSGFPARTASDKRAASLTTTASVKNYKCHWRSNRCLIKSCLAHCPDTTPSIAY